LTQILGERGRLQNKMINGGAKKSERGYTEVRTQKRAKKGTKKVRLGKTKTKARKKG